MVLGNKGGKKQGGRGGVSAAPAFNPAVRCQGSLLRSGRCPQQRCSLCFSPFRPFKSIRSVLVGGGEGKKVSSPSLALSLKEINSSIIINNNNYIQIQRAEVGGVRKASCRARAAPHGAPRSPAPGWGGREPRGAGGGARALPKASGGSTGSADGAKSPTFLRQPLRVCEERGPPGTASRAEPRSSPGRHFSTPARPRSLPTWEEPRDGGRSRPSGKRFSCYRVSRNERGSKGATPWRCWGLNSGQQIQARGLCLKTALGFHLLRNEHSGSKHKFWV